MSSPWGTRTAPYNFCYSASSTLFCEGLNLLSLGSFCGFLHSLAQMRVSLAEPGLRPRAQGELGPRGSVRWGPPPPATARSRASCLDPLARAVLRAYPGGPGAWTR